MADLAEIFGRRLKEVRKGRGLTQQDLAKQVKLDDKHLGAVERGEKAPSFDAVERLAKVLKVEPYELFLPDRLTSSELEQSLRSALQGGKKLGGPAIEEFLGDLLSAVRKLELQHRS